MPRLDVCHSRETFIEATSQDYDSANMLDQLPIINVPLSSLENGFFLRGTGTDPAHVRLLAEIGISSELPPILVQKNGFRIVDGMHRIEAAKLCGAKSIRARFIDCSDEDAFILAIKSNTLHGLPLSRTDRVFGAKRILTWHPDWSDRAIGAASGLSAKTVAGLRRRSDDEAQQVTTRLGRDGKRRPISSTDGRRRAADYIAARPDAPLREVARETSVSLGTVQDVRARMRSGADPIAVGRRKPHLKEVPNPPTESASRDSEDARYSFTARGALGGGSPQATWAAISPKLANDPSLRYSECGKAFFRWMAKYAIQEGEWREFIDAIPPHWLSDISLVADSIQDEWHEFAQQLRKRLNLPALSARSADRPGDRIKWKREVSARRAWSRPRSDSAQRRLPASTARPAEVTATESSGWRSTWASRCSTPPTVPRMTSRKRCLGNCSSTGAAMP